MQHVKRFMNVLETLADSIDGISISELSSRICLAKSTTHRILKSLMNYNMVTQDVETKKYHLGLEVLILGNKALEGISIREIARPYLIKLRDEINETVFLSVLDNKKVVCVEKFDTYKKLRYFVRAGNTMPPHCAASSKAIMAFQSKEVIEEISLKTRFLRYTDLTITKPESLMAEYEEIRMKHYAMCNMEMEDLVIAVAAPIFDWDSKVRSSICTLGLTSDLSGSALENVIKRTMETADEITKIWSKVKRNSEAEIS